MSVVIRLSAAGGDDAAASVERVVKALQAANVTVSASTPHTQAATGAFSAFSRVLGTEIPGAAGLTIGGLAGVASVAAIAQQAFQAVTGAITGAISTGVQMNAFLETTRLQFTTLTGSASVAREHVQELFKIGSETPFSTEEIVSASRSLEVFGGRALDTRENILRVGDAAAATNNRIQEVAFWFGRAYSQIQGGQPFGEARMRLQELGVLTGQEAMQLERLDKSGASATQMQTALNAALDRSKGAMSAQAQALQGLTGFFADLGGLRLGEAMLPVFESLKAGLIEVNAALGGAGAVGAANAFAEALHLGLTPLNALISGAHALRDAMSLLPNLPSLPSLPNVPGVPQGAIATGFAETGGIVGLLERNVPIVGPTIGGLQGREQVEFQSEVGRLADTDEQDRHRGITAAATQRAEATGHLTEKQEKLQKAMLESIADEMKASDAHLHGAAAFAAGGGAAAEYAVRLDQVNKAAKEGQELARGMAGALRSGADEFRVGGLTAPGQTFSELATPLQMRDQLKGILAGADIGQRGLLAQALGGGIPGAGTLLGEIAKDPAQQLKDRLALLQEAQKEHEADLRDQEDERLQAIKDRTDADVAGIKEAADAEKARHDERLGQIAKEKDDRLGALEAEKRGLEESEQDRRQREKLADAQFKLLQAQTETQRFKTPGEQAAAVRTAQEAVTEAQADIDKTAKERDLAGRRRVIEEGFKADKGAEDALHETRAGNLRRQEEDRKALGERQAREERERIEAARSAREKARRFGGQALTPAEVEALARAPEAGGDGAALALPEGVALPRGVGGAGGTVIYVDLRGARVSEENATRIGEMIAASIERGMDQKRGG